MKRSIELRTDKIILIPLCTYTCLSQNFLNLFTWKRGTFSPISAHFKLHYRDNFVCQRQSWPQNMLEEITGQQCETVELDPILSMCLS